MGTEIIKVLDDLCRRFGIVIDWTSENIIPYLQQLCAKFVKWEISTSIAWICICVVIISIIIGFTIIANKTGWDNDEVWGLYIIAFIAGVLFFIIVGVQIFDIIECKTFPEKAIYDYITMNIINN